MSLHRFYFSVLFLYHSNITSRIIALALLPLFSISFLISSATSGGSDTLKSSVFFLGRANSSPPFLLYSIALLTRTVNIFYSLLLFFPELGAGDEGRKGRRGHASEREGRGSEDALSGANRNGNFWNVNKYRMFTLGMRWCV